MGNDDKDVKQYYVNMDYKIFSLIVPPLIKTVLE